MTFRQRMDRLFRKLYVKRKLSGIHVPFCTTKETLETCKIHIERSDVRGGAFLRFGDGDVWIANGKEDMLQERNQQMTIEMREAFSLSGKGILKALPLNSSRFGYEDEMTSNVHLLDDETAEKILWSTFEYFIGNKIYNAVALHHIAVTDTEYCLDFLRILKEKTVMFVGPNLVDNQKKEILFGDVPHARCPSENSYKAIDTVCDEVKRVLPSLKCDHGVIVVAMGCAGRIFMKRMLRDTKYSNYFYFDFGSMLDVFCGLDTRAWIKQTNIFEKADYLLKALSSDS